MDEIVFREDWLASLSEEILEPDRPIVDPHHHFFDTVEMFPHYDQAALWADTDTHNVEQTVYVECGEHYRENTSAVLAPVGEIEWVTEIAVGIERSPLVQASTPVAAVVLRGGGNALLCPDCPQPTGDCRFPGVDILP